MSTSTRSSIRFGAYELDLPVGLLRKNGIRVRCQEQPLQVLAALVERPGELVTREELRRRVWPQDTFVDFDHALNTAVKKIRAALNDDADAPRYIETVPRRGYRFVAPIEKSVEPPVEKPLDPAFAKPDESAHLLIPVSPPGAGANPRRLLAITVVAVVVLAVLVVAWRVAPPRGGAASTSPDFRRLTFELAELGDARFTPDGASVVYSAGELPHKSTIYEQRLDAPGPQQLDIADSSLLAVSPQAELAVLAATATPRLIMMHWMKDGTLARVPLNGGAPRELMPQAEAADWSPTGQLAVVRHVGDRTRLEFPVGKVLYETSGWIASPRFSPAGDSIAFLDHPTAPDDRGSVAIVDLNGNARTLSGFWESLRGLAWNPRGDEVWFAAARSGIARSLYAVTLDGHDRRVLSGRERRVLTVAGGLSLQDISRDGRVLLSRDNERLGMLFMGPGDTEPRELSWKDWSMVMDISPDGKKILFGEEGEDSGISYQVGLRPTDGSAPVILGSGGAQSLSPDGKWALSLMPPPDDQLVLLPTGAGTAKTLPRGPIAHYQFAGGKWFPDSSQIVFVASEAGHGPRCYVQGVDSGLPRPFTPEGMTMCTVSPTGRILALAEDDRAFVYLSTSSAQPDQQFKFELGDLPATWTPDGKSLYLVQTLQSPLTITRFDIATGRRQLFKRLPLPPSRAVMKTEAVAITPDGQSYAFTYSNHSSDLYVVQGLK